MRSILSGLSAFAFVAAAVTVPAQAQYRDDRYRRPGYTEGYEAPRGYRGPPPGYRSTYRGSRRPRCDRGTGGTIIGAIAGGLLGNSVAGRGDRGTGTIIGAGAGALAGRAIDRDC